MSNQDFIGGGQQPYQTQPPYQTEEPYQTVAGTAPATGEGPPSKTDAARDQASQVAGTAADQASAVADTAKAGGQQVAAQTKAQVQQVTGEARDQVGMLMSRSRDELQSQASTQVQRGAASLRNLSQQLFALAEGRTHEAGDTVQWAQQGAQKLAGYAERLEREGPQALLDDTRRFAARRPGVYLLAAAAAGFAVGRLARGAQAVSGDGARGDGAGTAGELPSGWSAPATTRGSATGYGAPVGPGPGWEGAAPPAGVGTPTASEASPSYLPDDPMPGRAVEER